VTETGCLDENREAALVSNPSDRSNRRKVEWVEAEITWL